MRTTSLKAATRLADSSCQQRSPKAPGPEVDDQTNPLKIKGVGELGICGAGGALANAVYNACGVRIREFPLTVDKVLAGLYSVKVSQDPM